MAGGDLSVEAVLGVVREFDDHGGASPGLVSWELCVHEAVVRPAWTTAVDGGLIEPAGRDLAQGEELWRLARAGWARLGISPAADARRRDAIERLGILSRLGDPALTALTRIASHVAGGAAAAVHVFDDRFQHRVAAHLAPLEKHPLHATMCRLVIDAERPIVTADARADGRLAGAPFDAGRDSIRFYASHPLRTIDEGIVIGTLCTFGPEPRELPPDRIRLLDDLAQQVVAQFELARLAADLGHLATHDTLTGAANRLLLADRLEQAITRSERVAGEVLVAVVDLVGLKRVNDEHGHAMGDALLVAVTERLQASVRTTDTVARLGGDEFALILELADDDGALGAMLARLRGMFAEPVRVGERQLAVRVSIGTALARSGDDLAAVLARADRAVHADQV